MPVLFTNSAFADSSGTVSGVATSPILAIRYGITSNVLSALTSTTGAAMITICDLAFTHNKIDQGFTVDGSGNINATHKWANNNQSDLGVGNVQSLAQSALPGSGSILNVYTWYSNGVNAGTRIYYNGTLIFSRSVSATGGALDTISNYGEVGINDWAILAGVSNFSSTWEYCYIDSVLAATAAIEQSTVSNGNTVAGWALNDASSGAATTLNNNVGGANLVVGGGAGATWVSGSSGASINLIGFQLSLNLGVLAASSGTITVPLVGYQLSLGNLGAVTRNDTAITIDGFQLTIGQGILTVSTTNSISAFVNPVIPPLTISLGTLTGNVAVSLTGFQLGISLGQLSIQTATSAQIQLIGFALTIALGIISIAVPFTPPINPPPPPQFGPGNVLIGIYSIEGCPKTVGYSIEMCPGAPNVPPPQIQTVFKYNGVIVHDGSHTYGAS